MKIGTAIRQIRLERGATQEEIALDAGTFAGNLSKIERGQQLPSIDLLEKIACALRTKVSGLFALAEEEAEKSGQGVLEENADYANEFILLRRGFFELNQDNKLLAVEFVKLLNRAQRGELR